MPARRMSARFLRFAFFAILVAGFLLPALATRTAGQSSPAQGTAQVIAQGLTAPPADRVVWRIVEQRIPKRIDARPSNRMQASTGFLLADKTAIFVADQRTKLRSRLAPGEAQFIPSGANQTWASLDDDAGTAFSLELVDRSAAKVSPEGDILFRGPAFSMTPGDYDVDLVRDDLSARESAEIAQSSFPVLIFVTAGQVEIKTAGSDAAIRLKAGEGASARGEISIRARGKNEATYVAAVIGDPVSGGQAAPTPAATRTATPRANATEQAEPKRTATPKPEPSDKKPTREAPGINDGSSLRIAVRLCREGMTYFGLDPRGCQRAEGDYELTLVTPDGARLRMRDASRVEPSFVRWSGLEPGEYVLVVEKMPDDYLSYSLDGFICCTSNEGYRVQISEKQVLDGTLYLFQADWGVGAPIPTAVPVVPTVAPPPEQAPEPGPGVDTDGDGLSDELELNVFGTSPTLIDSDGDTIPDGVEAFGTNGYLTAPALPDTDFDGVNDNIEIQNGTDPLDPGSR